MGIANSLHQGLRNAQAIRLYRIESGNNGLQRSRQCSQNLTVGQSSKTIDTAIIHGKGCREWNVVEIATKFRIVTANAPGKIVGKLVALFGPLNVRVRFPSKVSESGNINGYIGPARSARIVVKEATTRVLKAKFVYSVITNGPCVLRFAGGITVGLFRRARVGVLPESLIFTIHLNAVDGARTHVGT